MSKKQFKIEIDAPKEKVWDTLWNDATYPKWTAPFSEGSQAVTDWKKGSKVLFLDGKGSGMVSRIEDNKPNEFMSIKHLGMVKDGVEDIDSEKAKEWGDALENYTLRTVNGKTEVAVDMDVADAYEDYFEKTWPVALGKLKDIAEKN